MDFLCHTLVLMVGLGIAQGFAGLLAVLGFAHRKPAAATHLPPVTILKPVCGPEALLEEAVAAFCRQDYPAFQMVIGAQDPADPALATAHRIREKYSHVDIAIVVDPTRRGANAKIANLMNMLPAAKHGTLVIADSDLAAARSAFGRRDRRQLLRHQSCLARPHPVCRPPRKPTGKRTGNRAAARTAARAAG